jgi:chaperone modulatory protein CbpM
MIDLDVLITLVPRLTGSDLARWIANDWVRPDGRQGAWQFEEIDVARVRLICELRFDMRIDEEALPVVLLLLDQLYRMRRQVLALGVALEQLPPVSSPHTEGHVT